MSHGRDSTWNWSFGDLSGGSENPGISGSSERSAVFAVVRVELRPQREREARADEPLAEERAAQKREDGKAQLGALEAHGPLDVGVAADQPQVPDPDPSGPGRARLVPVDREASRMFVDDLAQLRAGEEPARRRGVGAQKERGQRHQDDDRPDPETARARGAVSGRHAPIIGRGRRLTPNVSASEPRRPLRGDAERALERDRRRRGASLRRTCGR